MTETELIDLRKSFLETFKNDLNIVQEDVKFDRSGERYWLVTVKPKREGVMIVGHLFQHSSKHAYQNGLHEFEIDVVAHDSPRFVARYLVNHSPIRIRKTDSIVIPIIISPHIKNHRFTNKSRYAESQTFISKYDQRDRVENLLSLPSQNHVGELSYLGARRKSVVHASGYTATVTYLAYFKAIRSGKFNLRILSLDQPVTIVAEDAALTILADDASAYYWTENKGSSSESKSFPLSNCPLRVGDILIVEYPAYTANGSEGLEFEITKTDFKLPDSGYDFWLKD